MPRDATPGHRLEAGTDRAVFGHAIRAQPAELQPGVTQPLGMRMPAAEQQVPLHPLVAVAVGFDPVRGQLTVEQERQGQRGTFDLPVPLLPRRSNRPSWKWNSSTS